MDLRRRAGPCLLFLTHNLSLTRSNDDDVVVVQAGAICEGSVNDLLRAPKDPIWRSFSQTHRKRRSR